MDQLAQLLRKAMNTKKGSGGGAGAQYELAELRTEKKKGHGDEAVVLRMELHCDGCARKVRKAIKGVQGVESVRTDVAAGTVTVAGNADPWDLRDRIIQATSAIDVAFVSPPNPPPPPEHHPARSRCHHTEKMPPPPPESTVVLNIQLHCEQGCINRIKRKADSIQGVKQVTVDTAKEQVIVKGTMDAKALPDILSAKLKRRVTAVAVLLPPNKQDNKAAADGGGGGDNHADNSEASTSAGGAKHKNKNGKQHQRGEAAAAAGDDHHNKMASWMSEEQQYQYQYPTTFPESYGRGGSEGLFSDENPNACSLM